MTRHIIARLEERGININLLVLSNLAQRCEGDVALIVHKFPYVVNDSCLDYRSRKESNGDLAILIVRNKYPTTVMFRRSNQPLNAEVLRVGCVCDITDIVSNYVIKEKK